MKNNNKNKKGYIKQQEEKFGNNFIANKNPKELYRDMPRILAEFVNCNIDIKTYGYMFLTNQCLEAVIDYCVDQMNLLYTLYRNYDVYSKMFPLNEYDNNILITIQRKYNAYDLIYRTFNVIKDIGSFNPLYGLQKELNAHYRDVLQRGTQI